MELRTFNQIDLADPFFDSLKNDYAEFEAWFVKKTTSNSQAYVSYENESIQAFLYLKVEEEGIADVTPNLDRKKWLKVGTFKVNPHGTRLGERFIKKILDYAIINDVDSIYVTVFPKHDGLIRLLNRYGFVKAAEKKTKNGTEDVLVKDMRINQNDLILNYPLISKRENRKYLLSIYPEFHTQLFPDSMLFNETYDLIQDVSHTNSIHKIYICFMKDVQNLNPGDLLVMYRTNDRQGPAWYRSVASSICCVEEVKNKEDFADTNEYLKYCESYSVFNRNDLIQWYNRRGYLFVIKMTYNIALTKRLNRKGLIEEIGLDQSAYWGFLEVTDNQFLKILKKGAVDESVIVN